MKKTKKLKTKKIKKEKNSSDYIRLTKTLATILEVSENVGLMFSVIYDTRNLEEKIISKILSLKENFAREDEGTKLEAENKRNLMEIIGMLTGDEVRLLEAGKKIKQTKEDRNSCDCDDEE